MALQTRVAARYLDRMAIAAGVGRRLAMKYNGTTQYEQDGQWLVIYTHPDLVGELKDEMRAIRSFDRFTNPARRELAQ